MNDNPTDNELEQIAWEWFAGAHPHEAHAKDPERFWQYFQTKSSLSRREMEALLEATDD